MSLTAAQLQARDGKLTASRVAVLMRGDDRALYDLWREMTGDPSYVPDDLSGVWPVQLGAVTEALNLSWYARITGHSLSEQGRVVVYPVADWAACTLDAFDAEDNAVIEAKHCGGFEKIEAIVERYQPQLHWQMIVREVSQARLSVIQGAKEPEIVPVEFDEAYGAELWERAVAFWKCVESLTPPVSLAPVEAPKPVETFRTVDMQGSNAWAVLADQWLTNKDAAKVFNDAAKELKAMVESDVGLVFGHGIQISRAKNGNLSIREAKS